jgi:hypothetical protein
MSSVAASEVLRVRRLLAHHVREIAALVPASPEDTAALTREVVSAIAAGVGRVAADAEALSQRIAERPAAGACPPPRHRDGTR